MLRGIRLARRRQETGEPETAGRSEINWSQDEIGRINPVADAGASVTAKDARKTTAILGLDSTSGQTHRDIGIAQSRGRGGQGRDCETDAFGGSLANADSKGLNAEEKARAAAGGFPSTALARRWCGKISDPIQNISSELKHCTGFPVPGGTP
jgi:hypothetical protein